MHLLTIILFFVYMWGFGFTATSFVNVKPTNYLERQALNIGIGLGIFPILSILLNFLHIPLDWKIFLLISIIYPLYFLFKKIILKQLKLPSFKLKIKKSTITLFFVFLIFFATFFMYHKGSFIYPYLEDNDPWGHAVGAKYVSIEKTAYDPDLDTEKKIDPVLAYIDPYPPSYDILMGILHQTSPDLTWTLKFFNALIISLGVIFFYLFAKLFIGNRNKALFATFILAVVPSYLSHFIWAHALILTILFPVLYAFEMIKSDKKWMYIAALITASIWVTQLISQPIKLTTMILIFLIVGSICYRRLLKKEFLALASGMVLSFLWWGAMIWKHSLTGIMTYTGDAITTGASSSPNLINKFISILQSITNPGGTASRAYTFSDIFIAQKQNMINNPIGIGWVISILALIGLVYVLWKYKSSIVKKENTWICITLFWLIFTFWGINGMTFPISIAKGAFRLWMLLVIPLALIAAEGFSFLINLRKNILIKIAIFVLIITGVILTSAQQKYAVNTAMWPTEASFSTPSEPFEYASWFNSIPHNTKVFMYAPREKITIGFGKFSCRWCQDEIDFRKDILDKDANTLHSFLKNRNYEYFIINSKMDYKYFKGLFGENKTNELLPQRYNEILKLKSFIPVAQIKDTFIVLRVT